MEWHQHPWAGPAIRAAGIACIAAAAPAAHALLARTGRPPAGLDYLLAVTAFIGASAGPVMTTLGAHLFDRIAVSSRWLSVGDLVRATPLHRPNELRLVAREPFLENS